MSDVSGTGPTDPRAQPRYRVMRAVVIGLGILMVLMFAAVIAGLFIKIKHDTPAPVVACGGDVACAGGPAEFRLPPGAKIVSSQTTNDRVVLHVQTPAGEEIDILDTESGRLVGQVKTAPNAPTK